MSALLTDLYQLTMAAAYFEIGRSEDRGVFHLYFRRAPFGGTYAVACGLEAAHAYLTERFTYADVAYLRGLTAGGRRIFTDDFLSFLERFGPVGADCVFSAVPEGTVVFPGEPVLRMTGPIWRCLLAETPLLNSFNFQTLIATKAARIREAAGSDALIVEAGLRRAQGSDGGLSASRASFVGGADATSNVLAGQRFDIPVRGTHSHAWAMSFPTDEAAFTAYAAATPGDPTFLVDTRDTVQGTRAAVRVGRRLREEGRKFSVRLDSGDLLGLSRQVRSVLDEAGFRDAKVVASGDLDEYKIAALRAERAPIDAWLVGTALATGGDQSALGGVFKMGAWCPGGSYGWHDVVKLSDDPAKGSLPGILAVERVYDGGRMVRDRIFDHRDDFVAEGPVSTKTLWPRFQEVLPEILVTARDRARVELRALAEEHRRLRDPVKYPVELSDGVRERRARAERSARNQETT